MSIMMYFLAKKKTTKKNKKKKKKKKQQQNISFYYIKPELKSALSAVAIAKPHVRSGDLSCVQCRMWL